MPIIQTDYSGARVPEQDQLAATQKAAAESGFKVPVNVEPGSPEENPAWRKAKSEAFGFKVPTEGPQPVELTPEEQKLADAQSGVDPFRDLDAKQLADLAVQDKDNFDIVSAFASRPELHDDPAIVQKAADATDLLAERGFKFSDLPGPGKILKAAGHMVSGLAKWGWNYASPLLNADDKDDDETKRKAIENVASIEKGGLELTEMARKGLDKAARVGVGLKFSPAEKVTRFREALARHANATDIAKGHGPFTTAVAGEFVNELEDKGKPIEPANVEALADPLSLIAFGKAFGAVGKVTAPVGDAAAAVTSQLPSAAGVGGAVTQGAGYALQGAGKVAEVTGKVASVAAPIVEGGIGLATGDVSRAITGLAGGTAGAALIKLGQKAQQFASGVKNFGAQVGSKIPVSSAYAQLGKDVLESVPGAAASIAHGAAMDIGLAAATSESPQDTQGVGIGTVFGALGAAKRIGQHTLSGQIIAPREYGIDAPIVRPSGALAAVHEQAFSKASPGVRARVNAVSTFAKSLGTEVVLLPEDVTAGAKALQQAGIPEAQARQWAEQKGFFTRSIDGKPTIVIRDPAAAPHEAQHAIQDVIGEEGNRRIDDLVYDEYKDQWDQLGESYAKRVDQNSTDWRNTVLTSSGWGRSEALERLADSEAAKVNKNPGDPEVAKAAAAEWESRKQTLKQLDPALTPDQLDERTWKSVLTPEEASFVANRYLAREIAAENFDALFKTEGATLQPRGQLPEKLARVVGNLVSYLGGNPIADRTSEVGKVPLSKPVISGLRETAKEAAPVVEPKVTPTGVKSTDEAASAKKLAEEAPDQPLAGGTRSPKELLGEIAQAIAQKAGVKINYLSAPDEPAASTTSSRETRREIIEAFRSLPAEARSLWEKTFFPDRVTKTKTGYQVQGWAPEVFASNAHKMAEFLSAVDPKLSPYEIDPSTKSFTADGWKQLYADTQKFVGNQTAGRTGSGEKIVVPESIRERGYFAPELKAGAGALDQGRADFISALFNFRLPDTARVQKGKLPLNLAGQEVSAATKPGRVEAAVVPRGTYAGPEAEAQGIAGRDIKEVNPLRNQIEAAALKAGRPIPSMIEAIQKLNLENIKEVQLAPEQPEFRGNSLTLSAGFQPELAKEPEAIKIAAVRLKNGKIFTADDSRTHGGAIRKASNAGEDIAGSVDGFVTNDGKFLDRRAAFKRAKDYDQITGDEYSPRNGELESVMFEGAKSGPSVRMESQFQPQEKSADEVKAMGAKEFRDWTKDLPGGFTRAAYDLAKVVDSQESVDSLKAASESLNKKAMEMLKAGQMDDAMAVVSQAQFFNEAWQYATGEGSGGESAAKEGFKPKFKSSKGIDTEAKVGDTTGVKENRLNMQSQPASSEEVRKVAEDYAKKAGITSFSHRSEFAPVNEDLAKRLADHYEAAKSDPDNAAVQKSYTALADETIQQYHALTAAGYHVEPWTGKGEPYKSSAEMVNDVRQNKHLWYLPTNEAFGQGTEGKNNPMLRDSGIEVNGETVPVNDIFRAVHDFFGHAKEGYQFGPRGEFNAWKEHAEMFSPDAQGALAAETLAQNSWVNYGKHLRDATGRVAQKGEAGYVAPTDRPFAEQKNIVLPKELIEEARGVKAQAQPEAKEDDFKFPGRAPSGFKKAWILPDGKPVQLGGEWHHQWLEQNKDVAEKFGVKNIPPFEGSDAAGVREEALKNGFVRVNYQNNSGTLTVEARAADWRKQKDAVRKLVEENVGEIDNMRVSLTDESGTTAVRSGSAKLFEFDDAEKLNHLPLMDEEPTPRKELGPRSQRELEIERFEREQKGQLQPRGEDELSLGFGKTAKSNKEIADMTKAELAEHFPEAVIPDKRDRLLSSDITESPLYKKSKDPVQAFADKLVEFAREKENDPMFQAGKRWYSEFTPLLKKEFGKDARLMAELLAATSPQTNVEVNFAYALDALESFRTGRFDKTIAKFEQGLNMLENGNWEAWYGKEVKAGRALEGETDPSPARFLEQWIATHDLKPRQSNGKLYGQHSLPVLQVFARRWLDLNKGPKTRNFVENLLGEGREATIDLWADRTMRRMGYEGFKPRWRILPKNQAGVSDADFHFAQKAFRRAADELGMEGDDLQGALWFAEKQLWAENGWGRLDLGDFRKEMEKIPLLRAGIKQRTDVSKAKAKPESQNELLDLVQPRNIR